MNGHAPLAPSSAARWVQCPGSVAMEAAYPETEESQASREGTAWHWAVAEVLHGRSVDVGVIAPNGVVLTDEMCDGADLMAEHVHAHVEFDTVLHIEETLSPGSIHAQNWGTPDVWAWNPKTWTLDVWDGKFGHRFVSEFENWQLLNYTALILDALKADDSMVLVRMHIVQPRCYRSGQYTRTSIARAENLRAHFNILRSQADEAMRPGASCKTGPECADCSARHACEAAQRASLDAADLSGKSTPAELPPPVASRELRMLYRARTALGARITGLEHQVEAVIRTGAQVPYFSLESSAGREVWTRPIEEVIALGQLMSVNVAKPGVLTPNQARKAGLPAPVVAANSTQPRGAAKLVLVDDQKARKIFGGSNGKN